MTNIRKWKIWGSIHYALTRQNNRWSSRQPNVFIKEIFTAMRNILQQYVYINAIFIIYDLPCLMFLTELGRLKNLVC